MFERNERCKVQRNAEALSPAWIIFAEGATGCTHPRVEEPLWLPRTKFGSRQRFPSIFASCPLISPSLAVSAQFLQPVCHCSSSQQHYRNVFSIVRHSLRKHVDSKITRSRPIYSLCPVGMGQLSGSWLVASPYRNHIRRSLRIYARPYCVVADLDHSGGGP
jgi:hypothetical protein